MNRVVSISFKLLVVAVWFAMSPKVAADTCYTLTNGLVNWWPANGSSLDVEGANHATLLNGVTYTNGKVGQAFRLTSSNSSVFIGASPMPIPWSAEFWVMREPSPHVSSVLLSDTNTALKLEQYFNTTNNRKVGFTRWGVADYSFNYIAPTGQWTHLVFTGTSSNTSLYANGAFVQSIATNISLPRVQLGNDITNRYAGYYTKGPVDEVSFYNRVLTAGEIQSLYLAGTAGKCETGLPPLLFGWGRNYFGQIDPLLSATNFRAISAGGSHSLALLSNGVVRAWGYNGSGETNVPAGVSNVMAIAAGGSHSMALLSNGVVRAWGYNGSGQTNVPNGVSNVMAIAAGGSHSMALLSNGVIKAWGFNFYGQTNVPNGVSNVMAIAAGGSHSMALLSNGTVRAWGNNGSGQTNVPIGISNVVAIAAGGSHSMALLSNGTVIVWGNNLSGQTNVPVGISTAIAIAAGADHSLALLSNKTVVAWGSNYNGQTNMPFGLSNVVRIAAGGSHNLSLAYSQPTRPANDNFYNATPISGGNVTVTGSNINATEEPGEPYIAGSESHSSSVWWKWTAPTSGVVRISTAGSSFVPLLGIETGSNITNISELVSDFGDGGSYSRITNFPVVVGQTYYIAVDGHNGTQGNVTLSLVSPPSNNNFANSQTLIGSNLTFRASTFLASSQPSEPGHSTGQSAQHSVWFSWKAPITGGAVIFGDGSSAGEEDLDGAAIAVYAGTNLTGLTRVAWDYSLDQVGAFEGYDGPAYVRVVFNAVSNETYRIAVDGRIGSEGFLDLSLQVFPPPSNDAFSNRLAIAGNHYATNGTFIGSTGGSGEIEELNHLPPSGLGQTLWWSWTAPTNNGVSNSEVRLQASGVSFAPGIDVYLAGNPTNPPVSYGSKELTNALPVLENGAQAPPMTRMVYFAAQAGQTYNMVLSGTHFRELGGFISPRFGDFAFSLQNRVLAMTVADGTWEVDEANNTLFSHNVVVRNFGATASSPLRILVSATSGVSATRLDDEAVIGGDQLVLTTLPTVPFTLASGQTNIIPISGVIPPPLYLSSTNAKGYAAYAQLQEQSFPGIWSTVDEAFIVYGVWPTNTGVLSPVGPGGGVIRIDPGPSGGDTRELIDLDIIGPGAVNEGSITPYAGAVAFDDGFQTNVTTANWNSTMFFITNGQFSTGSVQSNTPVTLTIGYPSAGFLYSSDRGILVSNLPPPTLGQATLVAPTSLVFQVQGVPNRKHEIQTSTNLNPPVVWTKISTNTVGVNGLLNVTNVIGTNSQRFFRAREAE